MPKPKNETIKDSFHAKGLLEAKEKLDSLKLSAAEQQEYQRYIEDLSLQKSLVVSNYRDDEIDGLKKGRIEGKIEGKIEGRIEGELEGKLKVAKNLKTMGMAIDVIQKATGLNINEINNV